MLVDLALSGMDSQVAKKAFLASLDKDVDKRVTSFLPKNRVGTDPAKLVQLVMALIHFREVENNLPSQQQSVIMSDLGFDSLPHVSNVGFAQAVAFPKIASRLS